MNFRQSVVLLSVVYALGGCSSRTAHLLDPPQLTPVGSGITDDVTTGSVSRLYNKDASQRAGWEGGPADYFRDSRARRPGDLITIQIDVNDKANFANSTNRKKESSIDSGADFTLGFGPVSSLGKTSVATDGASSASGQGSVVRSEKLNVSMAAVVRDVLPNGNIIIEGSQEILVNNERRDLRISGIVDPRNIAPDNTIGYSKIAEARIYYGGSGKVSEVQTPPWGVQLWDKINPF